MLVHWDFSFSDLCALTRERRREELCSAVMMAFPDLVRLERAYERVHGLGARVPRREDTTVRSAAPSYEFRARDPFVTRPRHKTNAATRLRSLWP